MSRRIADLLIKIGADSYEFQQKTKQVEKSLAGLSKGLTSIGKNLSLKVTAPLTALGVLSVHNADIQAKAEAKVQTALTATGKAVGYSLDQLKDYASELQGKTIFGDETILNDVTTKLLSFTNITGENFKRTQAIVLDMSTALDMDLRSAALQVGKALSDPITKLSSLARAGIIFDEQQTEMIKTMAKTGETAKAQALILDALESKFGGQAQAAAQTGMGAIQQLKNAWGDFIEQVGALIMPLATKISQILLKALSGVSAALSSVTAWMDRLSPSVQKVIVAVAGIAAALGPVSLALGGIIQMLPALKAGFLALMSPVGALVAAVLALGAAFAYAKVKKREMLDDMTEKYENLSLHTLEGNLKENRRQQAVLDNESSFQGQSLSSKIAYAVDKPKKRKELQMEEEALKQAIENRKKALAEQDKAEKESAAIAQQMSEAMNKALGSTGGEVKKQTGIIADLQNEIAELEKRKMLPTSTVEDIAECNEQIAKLQERIQYLQKVTPDKLNVLGDGKLEVPSMTIEAPKLEVKMPDLKATVSEYHKRAAEIFSDVREGIYGWADNTSTKLQDNLADTVSIVQNYTDTLTAKGWKFSEALEHVSTTVRSTMEAFDQQVSAFLADSISAAAEAIGQMIAGDLGFGGLMKAILTQFANFLKNIGSQLIEFGVMIVAFKSTLKSVLANPWAAIGVGAAMVAAAAVMTALINKNAEDSVPALASGGLAFGKTYALIGDNANASVDPEVIAPLSRLKDMLPTSVGAQSMDIRLGGELTAKGRDLVYVLNKENFKSTVLGG